MVAELCIVIFMYKNRIKLIQTSLEYVSSGPVNNRSKVVKKLTWCLADDRPLSELMIASFTNA